MRHPWHIRIDQYIWNAVTTSAVHGPDSAHLIMKDLWECIDQCAKKPVLWTIHRRLEIAQPDKLSSTSPSPNSGDMNVDQEQSAPNPLLKHQHQYSTENKTFAHDVARHGYDRHRDGDASPRPSEAEEESEEERPKPNEAEERLMEEETIEKTSLVGSKGGRVRLLVNGIKSNENKEGEEEEQGSDNEQRPAFKRPRLETGNPEMSGDKKGDGGPWDIDECSDTSEYREEAERSGNESSALSEDDEWDNRNKIPETSGDEERVGENSDEHSDISEDSEADSKGHSTSEEEILRLTEGFGDEHENGAHGKYEGRVLRKRKERDSRVKESWREADTRNNEPEMAPVPNRKKTKRQKAKLSQAEILDSNEDEIRELTEAEVDIFFKKVRSYPETKAKVAFKDFERRLRGIKVEHVSDEEQIPPGPLPKV
jgi:hypothetical protein